MNLSGRTYLWPVVFLRVWVGYYMLQQGIRKYLSGFAHGDWVTRQIGDMDKVELISWYKSFLVNVVIPNRELFGYLVTSGEILIGFCLIIGLLVRLCSAVALFQFANYVLGPGMARGGATLANSETFFIAMIVFLFTNAGRTLGADGLFFRGRSKGPS